MQGILCVPEEVGLRGYRLRTIWRAGSRFFTMFFPVLAPFLYLHRRFVDLGS